jgi:hypothetical protein
MFFLLCFLVNLGKRRSLFYGFQLGTEAFQSQKADFCVLYGDDPYKEVLLGFVLLVSRNHLILAAPPIFGLWMMVIPWLPLLACHSSGVIVLLRTGFPASPTTVAP